MTTMTPETIQRIQTSWASVTPIADRAATLFYEHLFDLDPALRSMFSKTDMAAQREKLLAALSLVVTSLEDLTAITPTLRALGARHAGYGVTASHYDSVGTALLRTLEQGLGDGFTPEVKAAWIEAYTTLATVMQDAAAEVGEPAKATA